MSGAEGRYRPRGGASGSAARPSMPVRLALVTGGHRRLGAAIACALADAGYALAIHGNHDTELDRDLRDALERNTTSWEGFVADFSDSEVVEKLVANVAATFGRPPDVLVNSAAIFGQDRLENVTASDLMNHYAVNCVAPALLTKAFANFPAGAVDRCIINILDQRIMQPHGDQFAYTLSKMALTGLTRVTARELAPRIRVNAVAPGLTLATKHYSSRKMAKLAGAMPLERLPAASQIAEAVLYLAQATAMTGQTLYVDGGAHMKGYPRDFMHLK